MDIQALFDDFCHENDLDIQLSYEMPNGYETALGTFDVTSGTLFLNLPMLQSAPAYEVLFYFYHELRHAVQYLHPERFGRDIQESLPYVILYNGTCFRLVGNVWRECVLNGAEDDFVNAYLSLPYEMDANEFACQAVKQHLGASTELESLRAFWIPKQIWTFDQHRKLFHLIDQHIL